MSYPDFLIDKRVVQRNMSKGTVKKKEYEKLLAKLPDVAANAEPAESASDDLDDLDDDMDDDLDDDADDDSDDEAEADSDSDSSEG
jgi:RNA polymerase primary sigma factor